MHRRKCRDATRLCPDSVKLNHVFLQQRLCASTVVSVQLVWSVQANNPPTFWRWHQFEQADRCLLSRKLIMCIQWRRFLYRQPRHLRNEFNERNVCLVYSIYLKHGECQLPWILKTQLKFLPATASFGVRIAKLLWYSTFRLVPLLSAPTQSKFEPL